MTSRPWRSEPLQRLYSHAFLIRWLPPSGPSPAAGARSLGATCQREMCASRTPLQVLGFPANTVQTSLSWWGR